jgi:hypothetical protein
MQRPRAAAVLAVLVAAAGLLISSSPASGGIVLDRVVQTNPANTTPHLVADTTNDHPVGLGIWQATTGSPTFVGGSFHAIQPPQQTGTKTRRNIAAFNTSTGAVLTSFAPTFDGPVWQIRGMNSSLYVVGEFTHVNGFARRGIAKIDAGTGAVDTAFNAAATIPSGIATDVRVTGGRVLVGGTFPKRLAALSPTSGADTQYLNLNISGTVASNAGPTKIYRFEVDPAGTHLVAIGNFTSVAGQSRYRAFMVDLGTAAAALDPWHYLPLNDSCAASKIPAYLRDVDFDPSGRYFVLVSSGNVAPRRGFDVCDAAARFEIDIASPASPTWINYTGGDTLHSVAVSSKAVYVQGHPRWLDNPFGRDSCGSGCVARPGIGAIDPASGMALSWNPTKDRGEGGKDLLVTPQGLWVVSDTSHIGGEYHSRVALLPE